MAYFEAVVGDVGPASSLERRRAYLTRGPGMVRSSRASASVPPLPRLQRLLLERQGRQGDAAAAIETVPFDARDLGAWVAKLQPGPAPAERRPWPVDERSPAPLALQPRPAPGRWAASPSAPVTGTVAAARGCSPTARRSWPSCWSWRSSGGSRSGRETPLDDLVVEDGRRRRVVVRRHGRDVRVRGAPRACCSAPAASPTTPRCARSTAATSRTTAKWSIANPGDTGEVHRTGDAAAAPRPTSWTRRGGCQSPRAGRFGSHARPGPPAAAHDLRRRRRAALRQRVELLHGGRQGACTPAADVADAVPCWLVFDDRVPQALRPSSRSPPGDSAEGVDESGQPEAGRHARGPGRVCGIDAGRPAPRPSNASTSTPAGARTPTSAGASPLQPLALGDPNHKVEPLPRPDRRAAVLRGRDLCPATSAPAAACSPTSTHGCRAEDGAPIPGLYATGNSTATVMGRHYLGAGRQHRQRRWCSAFVAARDAAERAAGAADVMG